MKKLTFNKSEIFLPKDSNLSELYDTHDLETGLSCLQGKCGKCVVKVIDGDLGEIRLRERDTLNFLNLEAGVYRLLCQTYLRSDSTVVTT